MGDHHALGQPGRAASAPDGDDIVGACPGLRVGVSSCAAAQSRRLGVSPSVRSMQTNALQPWHRRAKLIELIRERAVDEQEFAPALRQDVGVLGRRRCEHSPAAKPRRTG